MREYSSLDITISSVCAQSIKSIFEKIQKLIQRYKNNATDDFTYSGDFTGCKLENVLEKIKDAIENVGHDLELDSRCSGGMRGYEIEELRYDDDEVKLIPSQHPGNRIEKRELGEITKDEQQYPTNEKGSYFEIATSRSDDGKARECYATPSRGTMSGENDVNGAHGPQIESKQKGQSENAEGPQVKTEEATQSDVFQSNNSNNIHETRLRDGPFRDQAGEEQAPSVEDGQLSRHNEHPGMLHMGHPPPEGELAEACVSLEKKLSDFKNRAHKNTAYFWAKAAIYELGMAACKFSRGRRALEILDEVDVKVGRLDDLWRRSDGRSGVQSGR